MRRTLKNKLKRLPKVIVRNKVEYSFDMFWHSEVQEYVIEYTNYDPIHQCIYAEVSCSDSDLEAVVSKVYNIFKKTKELQ